jgi:hypothetical protein
MKIKLFTGKTVGIIEEYGFDQSLKAAEIAEVPAEMSYADNVLLNIAAVLVAVTDVDGKPLEEVTDGAVKSRDMLIKFRKAFTDKEWKALEEAINEVYPDEKKPKGPAFEILS